MCVCVCVSAPYHIHPATQATFVDVVAVVVVVAGRPI
jgi:hypothetical protein